MDRPKQVLPGTKRARTRDDLLISAQLLLQEHNAAELRIRQITDQAGLVHASFYNYYPEVSTLIADLGNLLSATHAANMAQLVNVDDNPAARFARITRQTLRVVSQQPFFGRLMFDVGLQIDALVNGMRLSLAFDIMEGVSLGLFDPVDIEIVSSMMSGAIRGLSLDLHRGTLAPAKIDAATARLLSVLGVDAEEADRLAFAPIDQLPPIALPMRWLALPPAMVVPLND